MNVSESTLLEVRLDKAMVSTNTFHLDVRGPISNYYVLWVSFDLNQWTPLATNWVVDGYTVFNDPDPALDPRRFYRVSAEP